MGDNRNALELAKSFEKTLLDSNTNSVIGASTRLATKLSTQARSSSLSYDVQRTAFEEASRQRSDRYGVSLDEEAADLLRYQQAYQAVARVIRASGELFDTLLGVAR